MTSAIEERDFGRTGEKVTFVGLGGAPLRSESDEEGMATVGRALELGVTYVESSPGYQTQAVLGRALVGRREPFLVATKVGYFDDPADFRSKAALRSQIETNLRLLGRDSVDVLQVHEADWRHWWADGSQGGSIRPNEAYEFDDAPVMQVLREAKDDGLCRFIGITGNKADVMTHILRHVDIDVFLLAFHYDLIRRSARLEALPLAKQKGVATVLGAIYHNGQLARPHPEWIADPPEWMTPALRDRFARLYAIQRESGLSLPTLVIRFLLSDEDVDTVLLGCRNRSEVEEGVSAVAAGRLPTDLYEACEQLGLP